MMIGQARLNVSALTEKDKPEKVHLGESLI